ncbi:pilin [Viridibacterium curvum]|uniref:Uncharacterized protein n=1 Tax=Viridibacterium curvum TaxID=1101404 RepID=A0ABP9QQA5_9RHOO
MASGKTLGIAVVIAAVVAAGFWMQGERSKLAAEKARLAEAEARLGAGVEQGVRALDAAAGRVGQETAALNDAVSAGASLAAAQRQRALQTGRLMEAFVAAMQVKAAIVSAYQSNDAWPRDNREAGVPAPEDFRNERIYSLYVQPGGQIRVVLAQDGKPAESLILQGSVNRAGLVSWQCSSPDLADIEQLVPACKRQGEGS